MENREKERNLRLLRSLFSGNLKIRHMFLIMRKQEIVRKFDWAKLHNHKSVQTYFHSRIEKKYLKANLDYWQFKKFAFRQWSSLAIIASTCHLVVMVWIYNFESRQLLNDSGFRFEFVFQMLLSLKVISGISSLRYYQYAFDSKSQFVALCVGKQGAASLLR